MISRRLLCVLTAVATAATTLVWLPPLFRPRGGVLGFYRIRDILIGVPLVLFAMVLWTALVSRRDRRQQRVLRLLLVFGSFGLTWCLADTTYIWVTHDDLPHPARGVVHWNLPDPELGYVRRPHIRWKGRALLNPFSPRMEYRTDGHGFRNPEGVRKADIVIVGDSFVEAGDVAEEETFARLVSKRLGVTGVNLGRGGYGPQQELLVIERYALSYSPRLIVWVLFEGNDLSDALRYTRFLEDPTAVELWPARTPDRWEPWITSSLTVELLRRLSRAEDVGDRKNLWGTFAAGHRGKHSVSFFFHYKPTESVDNPVGWHATRSSIDRGLELAHQHDIRLLVAFIPTKLRAMGPYVTFASREKLRERLSGGDGWNSDQDFESAVRKYCAEARCEFVSATPALRQASAAGDLTYFQFEEHLNSAGNTVVADVLVRTIISRKLLSGGPLNSPDRSVAR
jgi:hypothetical protein